MTFDIKKLTSNNLEAAVSGLKAIANPNRLQILCALLGNELTVGDMAKQFGLSQSALSQHLSRMKSAGILTDRRSGNQVFYKLQARDFEDLLNSLCKIYDR